MDGRVGPPGLPVAPSAFSTGVALVRTPNRSKGVNIVRASISKAAIAAMVFAKVIQISWMTNDLTENSLREEIEILDKRLEWLHKMPLKLEL